MDEAVVCLWLGSVRFDEADSRALVSFLLGLSPLAVIFGGEDGEVFFDRMLRVMNQPGDSELILIKFSAGSMDDCVEEFFFSTWPPEERWDNWKRLVFISPRDEEQRLQLVVEAFLNRKQTMIPARS